MSSSVGEAPSPVMSDRSISSTEDAPAIVAAPSTPVSSPAKSLVATPPAAAGIAPQNPFNTMEKKETTLEAPSSPSRSETSNISPMHSPLRVPVAPSTPSDKTITVPRHPQSAPPPANMSTPVFPTLPSQPVTEVRPRTTAAFTYRPQPQPVFDDDENTEPSSMAATAEPSAGNENNNTKSATHHRNSSSSKSSFARFVQYTRRRLSQDSEDVLEGAVISGYLQKLGRNGKWQTRWFETDGECLSYYKSNKRTKLLATLDLEKVGEIGVDENDEKGCAFAIQVLGRLYHLRAENRATCKDWVITLNRVKEARMQQGNVKLVEPVDLLDSDTVTPRIVVVANRERTRAVDEWDRLMIRPTEDDDDGGVDAPTLDTMKRRSTLGTVVLARWSKRKTSLNRLSAKLARWARSVRKYGCSTQAPGDVVSLDHHVHPPGHDDPPGTTKQAKNAAWIGKEPTTVRPKPVTRDVSECSEDGARYLS